MSARKRIIEQLDEFEKWYEKEVAEVGPSRNKLYEGFDILDVSESTLKVDQAAAWEARKVDLGLVSDWNIRMKRLLNEDAAAQEFQITYAKERITVAEKRAKTLHEMGYLADEELQQVVTVAESTEKELEEARASLRKLSRELSDWMHKSVEAIAQKASDFTKVQLQDEIKDVKKAYADWTKQMKHADQAERAAAQRAEAATKAWIENPGTETAEAMAEAIKAREEAAKTAGAIRESTGKTQKELADLIERSETEYRNSAMKLADKGLQQVKVKMASISQKLVGTSKEFNIIFQHGTTGMERYLKDVSGSLEFDSELWKEARLTAEELAKPETEAITKEIAGLEEILSEGGPEAFYRATAKLMAPSTRLRVMMTEEFAELRETAFGLKWLTYANPMSLARGGRQIARGALWGFSSILERIMGVGAVDAIARLASWGISAALDVLFFVLDPMLLFGAEAAYDLMIHGFGWRFFNDLLGMVGMSLEMIDPALALKQYPKFSKNLVGQKQNRNVYKLFEYNWEELSYQLDYWGQLYVKVYNDTYDGKHLPEYKKLKPYKSIQRLPGLYIDPKNHPYDTDNELDECMRLERELSHSQIISPDMLEPSLVSTYLPKLPGLVRNLATYPVYKRTFDWVNLDHGTTVQTSGNFSESDMDPTIVKLFKKWAQLGTYGAAWNAAKTKHTQQIAAEANRNDYLQFINMEPDWYMARSELKEWLGTARAKQAIGASEMIILAPDVFDHEWNNDLPPGYFQEQIWFIKVPQKEMNHMNKEEYNRRSERIGRYTYHPKDRKFLDDIVNHNKMLDFDPDWTTPPDHDTVEFYTEVLPDPATGKFITQWFKLKYRPPTAEEKALYTKVYNNGLEYRKLTDERSQQTKLAWEQDIFRTVWASYVAYEKPSRTLWGYISKYRQVFIEELIYATTAMNTRNREKFWKGYLRYIGGHHIPLNMNSANRSLFMGMFADAAYTRNKQMEAVFERKMQKAFGGFLENDLVTTTKIDDKDRAVWAKGVRKVVQVSIGDWILKLIGDLQCRIFVLKKPRVLVLALRGTNSAVEAAVDANIAIGNYAKISEMKNGIMNVVAQEVGPSSSLEHLTRNPDVMEVHRGFLLAYEAMRETIDKIILGYYEKYPDMEDMFITGHSLGAALTQIAALTVPRVPYRAARPTLFQGLRPVTEYRHPHCYMFASPGVGDARFARQFERYTGESVQIWNDGDVVVSLPPFLISNPDTAESVFKDELEAMKSITSKDNGMAFFIYLLEHVMGPLGLHMISDIGDTLTHAGNHLKKEIKEIMDRAKREGWSKIKISGYMLARFGGEAWTTYNTFRPLRGGSVFIRMDVADWSTPDQTIKTTGFDETTYDSGNSSWFIQTAIKNPEGKGLLNLHFMDTILGRLGHIVARNKDLFQLDTREFPDWAKGDITPHRKKPSHRGQVPSKKIAKMILDGEAEIIGYAHTKHHHKPWHLVPKNDVDHYESMLMDPVAIQTKIHKNSRKRHKTDKKDATYRGVDYF